MCIRDSGSSLHNPWLIRPGQEDVSGLLHTLQGLSASSAADPLSGKKAYPPYLPRLEHSPRLLVPVAYEIGHARNSTPIHSKQLIHVGAAQVRPQELGAKERRIPNDDRRFRPLRLARILEVAEIEHSVAAFDALQWAEDGVAQVGEAVREHPLDLSDPDHHPRQLGGVRVELDAQHGLGAYLRELHGHLQRERCPEDGLPLQVLERLQRQIEDCLLYTSPSPRDRTRYR